MDAQYILYLVLSAGGAAALSELFRGLLALRRGAASRTREAIGDLATWREQADDARAKAETSRDGWRAYAGRLEFALLSAGIKLPDGAVRPVD